MGQLLSHRQNARVLEGHDRRLSGGRRRRYGWRVGCGVSWLELNEDLGVVGSCAPTEGAVAGPAGGW